MCALRAPPVIARRDVAAPVRLSVQARLPPAAPCGIISPVMPERWSVFGRRVLAYNRQPRKLVTLPFSLTATVLAVYALWTGNMSITLMAVVVGLCIFVTVVDGVWWFVGYVVEGYRGHTTGDPGRM
jgi:hypothetical protein